MSAVIAPGKTGNRVLDVLPLLDREALDQELTPMAMAVRDFSHTVGKPLAFVYFPIDAVLSVVTTLIDGDSVECGTVGNESFVTFDAVLGSRIATRSVFCQVRGEVLRLPFITFKARMETSEPFSRLMRHNALAGFYTTQQFVACNIKHSLVKRCARWLAMTADRVGRSEFHLTHEFLAIMLGVRRAGVSEAANALQKMGAISYRRDVLSILDAKLLEDSACECYEVAKVAFASALTLDEEKFLVAVPHHEYTTSSEFETS